MLIEEKALRHWIDHFYGYGSWQAKTWLVAYEEGGGDLPEEVAEKFAYFSASHKTDTPSLCDIRGLYKHVTYRGDGAKSELFSNFHEYRFGKNAMLHGLWKNLIAFVHGYRHQEDNDSLSYQRNAFLQSSESLIQLYPLPSPHNHAWYYSWLDMPQLGFLKSRALYEEHVFEQRITTILQKINEHKPELVLMYGMNDINALKRSVQEHFTDVKFTQAKAIKLKIPQHHRAELEGTKLIITTQVPTLRHNRVETGFDWKAFGQLVRGN